MQDKYLIRICDKDGKTCEIVGPYETENDGLNALFTMRAKFAKHPFWHTFTLHYLRNPERFTED